jgi:hypothetical protein
VSWLFTRACTSSTADQAGRAEAEEALARDGVKYAAEEESNLPEKLLPALAATADELRARLSEVNLAVKRRAFLRGDDPKKVRGYQSVDLATPRWTASATRSGRSGHRSIVSWPAYCEPGEFASSPHASRPAASSPWLA